MDNRYRFRRVFLMLRTSNEDIQKYVDNSIQEGLEVSLLVQGEEYVTFEELLEREQEKSGRQRGELCREILLVTDDSKAAEAAKKQGVAVLGYRPPRVSRGYLGGVEYVAEKLSRVDEDFLNLVYMRAQGIPLTIAETQHTLIREMRVEDLPAMYELYEEQDVRQWVEPLYSYEEEAEFTRAYIKNMYGLYGYGLWLVFDRQTGELIGRAGISNRVINGEECQELGYIIRGERQRQGLGYEVSSAILQYAKEKLMLPGMYLCAKRSNKASIALAEKLGFEKWGEGIPAQKETAPHMQDCLIFYKEL